MPNTIVSSIGPDGEREGRKLAALHPVYCSYVPPGRLQGRSAFPLILVGHHSELVGINADQFAFIGKVTPWLVLANCSSGASTYGGPLAENNHLSPGQILANYLNIRVTSTSRPLTFDEVGRGTAFARSKLYQAVIPNEPDTTGAASLWVVQGSQDPMSELMDRFKLL